MRSVSDILIGGSGEDIVNDVLKGLEHQVLSKAPVEYRCYCSRERVYQAIESMVSETLEEIAESSEDTEVLCHFCSNKYIFMPEDIRKILNDKYEA